MKTALVAPLLFAAGTFMFGAAVLHGASRPGSFMGARYGVTRVEGRAFPKTIDNGTSRHVIARTPVRVASLTVTSDEVLTELLEPARIIAVTPFADDRTIETTAGRAPKSAARVRGIDPEALIALEPDLVFVANYTLESGVRILGSASIPVVKLGENHSYEDVSANVRLMAAAVGEETRGESLVAAMQAHLGRIDARTRGLAPPRVLYYSAVGYTAGTGTLVDEKIRRAGGRNVAAEAGLVGFKSVTIDLLVGLDPDIIVVPRWSPDGVAPVRDVTENVAWRDVVAVRHGRVYALAASDLTSESPEGVDGIEALARLFHPEAFAS